MIKQNVMAEGLLLRVAQDIFETMVFMSVDPDDQSHAPIKDETLLGMITFNGDIEGCLGLYCTEACAKAAAIDMLGLEPDLDLSAEDVNDAMGEIINMLMGSIKARAEALSHVKVSIPTVVRGRGIEGDLGSRANQMTSYIRIADQYSAELSLFWRRGSREDQAANYSQVENPMV